MRAGLTQVGLRSISASNVIEMPDGNAFLTIYVHNGDGEVDMIDLDIKIGDVIATVVGDYRAAKDHEAMASADAIPEGNPYDAERSYDGVSAS